MVAELVVALLVGLLQGIFEWLPISSEGNIAIVLASLGYAPVVAVQYALVLHLGTALAATAYYRGELVELAWTTLEWRPSRAFDGDRAVVTFLVIATLSSGAVGLGAYASLAAVASAFTGGLFVAGIGLLLIATGVLQHVADEISTAMRTTPTAADAVLVGIMQGLAILPGVSRSGTTVSALLLRGYPGEQSFRLSFLLSIPAAMGAAVLVVVEETGLPTLAVDTVTVALVTSFVVGYFTIDALMRVVRQVAFWTVCVGLGGLAVLGGVLVAVA